MPERELTFAGAVRLSVAVIERARADARGRGAHDSTNPEAAQREAQRWCDDVGIRWREEETS